MAFHPDIVVLGKDSPQVQLVVEARTSENEGAQLAQALKSYLSRMSCPFGLLIFPHSVWMYRNTFSSNAEEAVEETGRFPFTARTWTDRGANSGSNDFERSVQYWLEDVADRGELREGPPDMRAAFDSYIIPILTSGRIRAAGPRSTASI
jgi:hypothetical protein